MTHTDTHRPEGCTVLRVVCLTLSRYSVQPGAFTNVSRRRRTGYGMMKPAVPELRLIPADTNTHTHTHGGRGETEAEGDLWRWLAH